MTYTLRPYQEECVDKCVAFLKDSTKKHNGLVVASTGMGKSLVIAAIAQRMDCKVLVFCPSIEILKQNYEKGISYGLDCAIYSASAGKKEIATVTYVTIGSVKNQAELFKDFQVIITDECHLCNPKHGTYKRFFKELPVKSIGLTATPYRLESTPNMDFKTKKIKGKGTTSLRMLNKFRGAIYKEIIYNIETGYLVNEGYLSYINYYDITPPWIKNHKFKQNTSGADYDEKALMMFNKLNRFNEYVVEILNRLLRPKSGKPRNGILVFTRFVSDAQEIAAQVQGADWISGDCDKKEREQKLIDFKEGRIKVLINASILTTGYDRPDLDTVVLATPTMSLAKYSQIIGRGIRISDRKENSWFVDLCGSYAKFGRTDHLYLNPADGEIWTGQYEKQLTGVKFE